MSIFGDLTYQQHAPAKSTTPAGPMLNQLAGMDEACQWGEAVARDIALYRLGQLDWKEIDPGCVLHGPPGTGKTTYAKALAATCGLPLVATSYAEWQSVEGGNLSTTMAAMKTAFTDAIAQAPCILFIDELDSIPRRGTGAHNAVYYTQLTNAVLKEFDRLTEIAGVIVVGACNHPEFLDDALVRSGRMDRMIAIHLPTAKELEAIISFHLTEVERDDLWVWGAPDPLPAIGLLCTGMSGADVAKTVRGARSIARQEGRPVTAGDFFEVLDPPSKRPSQATQIRAAVHEAGHAVAGLRLKVSADITASIVSTKGSVGRVSLRPLTEPATQMTIENLMIVALAGRAAEELAFGDPSDLSGGNSKNNDLAQATRLACDAVTKLGFSRQRGLVWHAAAHHEDALLNAGHLVDEIKALLDAAYTRAKEIISADGEFLKALVDALIEHRVLSHADIVSLDETGRMLDRNKSDERRLSQPQQAYQQTAAATYAQCQQPSGNEHSKYGYEEESESEPGPRTPRFLPNGIAPRRTRSAVPHPVKIWTRK